VRSDFLATDAEDNAFFSDVSFSTMALLSNKGFSSDPDPQRGGEGIEEGGEANALERLPHEAPEQVREGCTLRGSR